MVWIRQRHCLSRLFAVALLFLLLLPPPLRAGEDSAQARPRPRRSDSERKDDRPRDSLLATDLTKLSPEERKTLLDRLRALSQAESDPAGATTPEKADAPTDDPMAEYAKLAFSLSAGDEEDKELFYYQCKNVRSSTLKRVLENFISSSGTVANSDESDIVVVSDIKAHVPRLREIAEKVDRRVPQVLVEAQIVELTLDSDFEKEIKLDFEHTSPNELSFVKRILTTLTTPGAQPTEGQGMNATFRPYVKNYPNADGIVDRRNDFTTFLRYLETKGKAKILSAPNLILRRGSEGSIITGQDVPIQEKTVTSGTTSISTKFKRVGIKLKVTPLMISDDTVRMAVNPEVSTVTTYSGENPIIALRSATTELEVKDGELISIGGLLRSENRTVQKRVPIASAIPIFGHFFRATRIEETKTHLVIFLTIRILDEGVENGLMIHRPRDIPEAVHEEIKAIEDTERDQRPRAQILQDLKVFVEEGRP